MEELEEGKRKKGSGGEKGRKKERKGKDRWWEGGVGKGRVDGMDRRRN